jgi:hypothetical protein
MFGGGMGERLIVLYVFAPGREAGKEINSYFIPQVRSNISTKRIKNSPPIFLHQEC